MEYLMAKERLIGQVERIGCEDIDIEQAYGRLLGEDIIAGENVPAFARSPYDGYAFRAEDTCGAEVNGSITLQVIDHIRAGEVSDKTVVQGTAVRLMTGAPLPVGADAVCKFEDTHYTDTTVTIGRSFQCGENVVSAGEDIKQGSLLAKQGSYVDVGLVGTLSSLGMSRCKVYKKLKVGVITTGDEVIPVKETLQKGKIRNSNRYTLCAALKRAGMEPVYIGHACDDVENIRRLIEAGEALCDVIVCSGGVSVGEYDLVPEAMENAGYTQLVRGVDIKPGMACVYGIKADAPSGVSVGSSPQMKPAAGEACKRLLLALSGNPASSLTNLECVCMPALRKMAGYADFEHRMIRMVLKNAFPKGAKGIRFIRGKLESEDGRLFLQAAAGQGNIVISSAIGANAYGILKDSKGPVPKGTVLEGFAMPCEGSW